MLDPKRWQLKATAAPTSFSLPSLFSLCSKCFEEEQGEPEEVESVTVCCCWCAYSTSQQVAGQGAALRPHCVARLQQQFEQEQQRCWQLEGLEERK
jgi:hypothetical protein